MVARYMIVKYTKSAYTDDAIIVFSHCYITPLLHINCKTSIINSKTDETISIFIYRIYVATNRSLTLTCNLLQVKSFLKKVFETGASMSGGEQMHYIIDNHRLSTE